MVESRVWVTATGQCHRTPRPEEWGAPTRRQRCSPQRPSIHRPGPFLRHNHWLSRPAYHQHVRLQQAGASLTRRCSSSTRPPTVPRLASAPLAALRTLSSHASRPSPVRVLFTWVSNCQVAIYCHTNDRSNLGVENVERERSCRSRDSRDGQGHLLRERALEEPPAAQELVSQRVGGGLTLTRYLPRSRSQVECIGHHGDLNSTSDDRRGNVTKQESDGDVPRSEHTGREGALT